MKKLMFTVVAALSFAVLAQDAEGPKAEAKPGLRRAPRDMAAMMQNRAMMPRGDMGGMIGDPAVMAVMNPKVAEKIGLSEEVRNQIKKLDVDNREKVKELQVKTRGAMEKQAQLMKAEKIDEAAVMSAIDELFDCRKEMAKAQTKRVIGIKALLTPEQLTKASEAMKAMREERMRKRPVAVEGAKKVECKEGDKGECKSCEAPAAK